MSKLIKIAVASNKDFKNKSLPILLPSLLRAGIERDAIHVFIGGYSEYSYEKNYDVHFHYLNHIFNGIFLYILRNNII